MMVPIESTDDARIDGFRALRDRDLLALDPATHADGALPAGAFVAEGEVVLRVLLAQARHPTRAVLVSDAQAQRLSALLSVLDVPVYVAPLPVLQAIVGFPIHRGVLALGDRIPASSLDDLLEPATRVVGLCGITNHDNVGGIFRNAAAFGVGAVLCDRATCDPLYRKALRVSVGGSLVVPYAQVRDETAVVEALATRGYEVLALTPRGELVIGRDPAPSGRVALLLGAEGPGLAAQTLRRCRTARVPMSDGWDSLNVAVTSGIALAWLRTAS